VEKLITSVHELDRFVDSQWTRKLLDILFWIRLRAASGGCRNLLRTSAREGGTETEPRIRTVRQLAAAAGDGWLGSVGSLGQLETSLNSGYKVGPCNSYLEGPTLFFWLAARASRAWSPTSSLFANEKRLRPSLLRSSGARFADARSFGSVVLITPARKRGASTRVPLPLTHRVAICDARGNTTLSQPSCPRPCRNLRSRTFLAVYIGSNLCRRLET
jgi:hypothetical protein